VVTARHKPKQFVVLTCVFRKEDKWVTAECQELGTATFGRNLDQAEERLREAILLDLNTLEDIGERARFFREHKIKTYAHYPETVQRAIEPDVLSKAHVLTVGRKVAFA
jgi:predicted RNase H-like HicB family nuclease